MVRYNRLPMWDNFKTLREDNDNPLALEIS